MSNRKSHKDTSPAFFKGEFSFVNKDANNIESKDHNAAVSWHVMNRYERFKKQQQARKLRDSANVPIGSMESSSQKRQRQGSEATTQQDNSPIMGGGQNPLEEMQSMDADPWLTEPNFPMAHGDPEASSQTADSTPVFPSNLSSPSPQATPDPFTLVHTSSADISRHLAVIDQPSLEAADTASLISFAYESFLPNLWPTERGNVQSSYEISRSWEDIASISQDDCYHNACLALLSIVKAERTDDAGLRHQSRLYQSQAIHQLRQRLSRPSPPDLFAHKAILNLFSCETCVDNTAAARTQLKVLRNVVAANGGVLLLDSWFREDLLSCDCYFAVKFGTRPLFPAGDWTPGPLSQPWKARLTAASMFGDHSASVDKQVEHPCLKTLVTDLRELFKTQDYILTHEVPAEDQLLRWRQLRKFDCISRLADHYTNLALYGHLYDYPKCQIMVTIALVLLTTMVLGSPEPIRFGTKFLEQLRRTVQEAEIETAETDTERLLLWVCYIGALGERVYPPGEDNQRWFNTRVKHMTQQMKLSGWKDIRKVIRYFLFSVRLHDEIVGERAPRTDDFCTGLYSMCGTSWRSPLVAQNEADLGQPSASR